MQKLDEVHLNTLHIIIADRSEPLKKLQLWSPVADHLCFYILDEIIKSLLYTQTLLLQSRLNLNRYLRYVAQLRLLHS